MHSQWNHPSNVQTHTGITGITQFMILLMEKIILYFLNTAREMNINEVLLAIWITLLQMCEAKSEFSSYLNRVYLCSNILSKSYKIKPL